MATSYPADSTASRLQVPEPQIPCQNCGQLAVKATMTRDDSLREATFLCASGHLFHIRWIA